jgi:hypothetical protein
MGLNGILGNLSGKHRKKVLGHRTVTPIIPALLPILEKTISAAFLGISNALPGQHS